MLKGTIETNLNRMDIPEGRMQVCPCVEGIRLENVFQNFKLEIHESQLISCNMESTTLTFGRNRPLLLAYLFRILALLTLGAVVTDLSGDRPEKTRKKICLLIHFWDPGTRRDEKIYILSRKRNIRTFLSAVQFPR